MPQILGAQGEWREAYFLYGEWHSTAAQQSRWGIYTILSGLISTFT